MVEFPGKQRGYTEESDRGYLAGTFWEHEKEGGTCFMLDAGIITTFLNYFRQIFTFLPDIS